MQGGQQTDDFTEEWATPIPPIPLEDVGGEFEGTLEDLQGRFNLNSLVTYNNGGVGEVDENAVKRLERLLEVLELEPKWAKLIADWIDSDNDPGFPDGAEDPVYTNLAPPYRTANMPITRASELLALPEFGADRYRKLAPYVTALPADARTINLCTASPELLDALVEGSRQFTLARESWQRTRAQRCFPNKKEFERRTDAAAEAGAGRRRSMKAAITFSPRSGSPLALIGSPCTVCCIAPTVPTRSVPS